MKTLYKYTIALLLAIICFTNSVAQTNSGSITMLDTDWEYDWDCDCGDYYKDYILTVSPNTPIKISFDTYTFNEFSIWTIDNNNFRYSLFRQNPTSETNSVTVISTTGVIYVHAFYLGDDMGISPVFELTYGVDPTYTISSTPSILQNDQLISGKLGIGVVPTQKLDVYGNIQLGTNYKIKLMDFPYHASWIDMPATYGKASGIGSGGPGQNAWIAFAGSTDNWFVGAAYGDICYRNTMGKLHFGNTSSKPAMTVYSNKIGVGTTTPRELVEIFGDNKTTKVAHRYTGSSNAALNYIQSDTDGHYLEFGTFGTTYTGSMFGLNTAGSNVINMAPKTTGFGAIGTFTAAPLIIGTNNLERIRIDQQGKIGIGTTTPGQKLDVVGNARINGSVFTNEIHFIGNTNGDDNSDPYTLRKVHDAGNASHLDLNLNDDSDESFRIYGNSCNGYGCGTYSGNLYHSFDASGNVFHAGHVSIGTNEADPTGALLTVKGIIHAREVLVDLNTPLADYVFSPTYTLKPLSEVEAFVKTNKHLPEIPSATEVKEKGLSMGEMQNKLLQKIEELTLYVIEQQKKIEELERKLESK